MSDVFLYHTPNGGGITLVNGQPEMTEGFESAVYLSLFGGNARDSGLESERSKQWWGNCSEIDPAKQQRSETQYLLTFLPILPANLKRYEDAALRDVAWITESAATSVAVSARIPAINTLALQVDITANGITTSIAFVMSPFDLEL